MSEHPDWDDACWQMILECEPNDDGFETPSLELVAKYCKLYPHLADDFTDFAATCRTEDFFVKKYPPPELTEADLKRGVQLAMKAFRKAMRNVKARKKREAVKP